jgi:hypothetical protein
VGVVVVMLDLVLVLVAVVEKNPLQCWTTNEQNK